MPNIFSTFTSAFSAHRETASAREGELRLSVMVAHGTDRDLISVVRDALYPQTVGARLYIAAYGAGMTMPPVNNLSNAAIIIADRDITSALTLYTSYALCNIPSCIIVTSEEDIILSLMDAGVRPVDILVCKASEVAQRLGSWLVKNLSDLAVVLGQSFICCRRARARLAVNETVRNNAILGALTFLKQSDLPGMLISEIVMQVKICETYGFSLDSSRLRELIPMAGSAFGFRGVARLLVHHTPLPRFIINGGIAAAGTYAIGWGLMAYYELMAKRRDTPVMAEVVSIDITPDTAHVDEPVTA